MSLSSSSSEESVVEHLQYKLVLLGDEAVGKTSIVNRLLQRSVNPIYTPTVGVEFYKAELQITDAIHATLQVWDIGSHVSSLSMAANYLQGCDAVLAVYDANRHETYSQVCQWLDLLQQMFQETAVPYIAVIANKVDSESLLQAAADQLQSATADIQQAYGYHVSAQTGANLAATFLRIAADLAGIPLTPQQIDAATQIEAAAGGSISSVQQRWQQPSSGNHSHLPGTAEVKLPISATGSSIDRPGSVGLRSITTAQTINASAVAASGNASGCGCVSSNALTSQERHQQMSSGNEADHGVGCELCCRGLKASWPLASGACIPCCSWCGSRKGCVKYP